LFGDWLDIGTLILAISVSLEFLRRPAQLVLKLLS